MKRSLLKESIRNLLRGKSEDEIIDTVLSIDDPNILLKLYIKKFGSRRAFIETSDRSEDVNKLLVLAILKHPDIKLVPHLLVYNAIKFGLEEDLMRAIDERKIHPESRNSIVLVWAVGYGLPRLVKKLLSNNKVKIENETIVEALAVAIARGKNDVLRILLEDGRIDPSADQNKSLKVARECGNQEAIDLLLGDQRVLLKDQEELKKQDNMANTKIVRESIAISGVKRGTVPSPTRKLGPKVIKEISMAEPTTKPTTRPGTKPTPTTKPIPPSPIRRDRPSVEPGPKAEKKQPTKATIEQVVEKYMRLIDKSY